MRTSSDNVLYFCKNFQFDFLENCFSYLLLSLVCCGIPFWLICNKNNHHLASNIYSQEAEQVSHFWRMGCSTLMLPEKQGFLKNTCIVGSEAIGVTVYTPLN